MKNINDKRWTSDRLAIVDVEGNGRTAPDIVEICVVQMSSMKVEQRRTWLLRPSDRITWHAKKIHGISNRDVEGCPTWSEVQEDVEGMLGGRWLVAHNAGVERRILSRLAPSWSPMGVVDTLKLARSTFPGLPSYKLSALLEYFGFTEQLAVETSATPHRAEYDALGTALLLQKCAGEMNTHQSAQLGLPGLTK